MGGEAVRPAMHSVGLALVVALSGCYTMRPAGPAVPPIGTRVALDVTDAGRVALGETVGPGVARIEGRLLAAGDSSYHVAVSTVRVLRGGTQVWTGEQVRIDPAHVGTTYIRQFDRTRTMILGAAIVGGITAFLASRSLFGSGSEDPVDPGDGVETRTVSPLSPLWRLNFRGAFP